MVKTIQSGGYKLLETVDNQKVLLLDGQTAFSWKNARRSGNLVYFKFNAANICCFLSVGNWRLYEVQNEAGLTNGIHFELHVGRGKWQGYILPISLPTISSKKKPIAQTDEIITKSRRTKSGAG